MISEYFRKKTQTYYRNLRNFLYKTPNLAVLIFSNTYHL
jgi:hypothetical protein